MVVTPLDTLLALKVLSFAPGLSASARAVGAILIERYNRRTGQCDPGIEGMADQLQVCTRTVIRSLQQLVNAGLFRRLRHGGHSNRNQYVVEWARFQELERAWSARLRRRQQNVDQRVSPSRRQERHIEGDSAVTQTCPDKNLHHETYCRSLPKEVIGRAACAKRLAITPRSQDAAEAEAERRWTKALHECFGSKPLTYGEIIQAITPAIQASATNAERQCRG